jgi:hypothetical protein
MRVHTLAATMQEDLPAMLTKRYLYSNTRAFAGPRQGALAGGLSNELRSARA